MTTSGGANLKKTFFVLHISIHITLVTFNGVHHNKYSGNIQSELTLDDLFRE